MPAKIFKVLVKLGDVVSAGDIVIVLESMKMEIDVETEDGSTVKAVPAVVGGMYLKGDILVEVD
ncbi:MAG: acetyl-CoA carboxylase biotin carboxyl carrier protein subunit [Oscillospiraceae bacterium]|nr:acetyl-CoA carboxylase biotin carboxyl carrier protein subunit [Oscillospiraceae bacterium]